MIPFHLSVRFHNRYDVLVVFNHKLQKQHEKKYELNNNDSDDSQDPTTLKRLLPDCRYLAMCGDGRIHVFGRGLKLLGQIDHWSISSCVPLLDSGLVTCGSELRIWNGHYQLVHQLDNVRDMAVYYTPADLDEYRKQILKNLEPFLLKDLCNIVFHFIV